MTFDSTKSFFFKKESIVGYFDISCISNRLISTVDEKFRWLKVTKFWFTDENYKRRNFRSTEIKADQIFTDKVIWTFNYLNTNRNFMLCNFLLFNVIALRYLPTPTLLYYTKFIFVLSMN